MKRYEIRVIDTKEMRRVAVYGADEFEVKTDDYGYMVDDHMIGQKVGFKMEGKAKNKWLHTTRNAIQIVDNEKHDAINIESQEEILKRMGREDMIR